MLTAVLNSRDSRGGVAAIERDLAPCPVHAPLLAFRRQRSRRAIRDAPAIFRIPPSGRTAACADRQDLEASRTPARGRSHRAGRAGPARARRRRVSVRSRSAACRFRANAPCSTPRRRARALTRSHASSAFLAAASRAAQPGRAAQSQELLERTGRFQQLLAQRLQLSPAMLLHQDAAAAQLRNEIEAARAPRISRTARARCRTVRSAANAAPRIRYPLPISGCRAMNSSARSRAFAGLAVFDIRGREVLVGRRVATCRGASAPRTARCFRSAAPETETGVPRLWREAWCSGCSARPCL